MQQAFTHLVASSWLTIQQEKCALLRGIPGLRFARLQPIGRGWNRTNIAEAGVLQTLGVANPQPTLCGDPGGNRTLLLQVESLEF